MLSILFFVSLAFVALAFPLCCFAQCGNTYAFEENGEWGFCYAGKQFVFPQYEAVANVSYLPYVFLARMILPYLIIKHLQNNLK